MNSNIGKRVGILVLIVEMILGSGFYLNASPCYGDTVEITVLGTTTANLYLCSGNPDTQKTSPLPVNIQVYELRQVEPVATWKLVPPTQNGWATHSGKPFLVSEGGPGNAYLFNDRVSGYLSDDGSNKVYIETDINKATLWKISQGSSTQKFSFQANGSLSTPQSAGQPGGFIGFGSDKVVQLFNKEASQASISSWSMVLTQHNQTPCYGDIVKLRFPSDSSTITLLNSEAELVQVLPTQSTSVSHLWLLVPPTVSGISSNWGNSINTGEATSSTSMSDVYLYNIQKKGYCSRDDNNKISIQTNINLATKWKVNIMPNGRFYFQDSTTLQQSVQFHSLLNGFLLGSAWSIDTVGEYKNLITYGSILTVAPSRRTMDYLTRLYLLTADSREKIHCSSASPSDPAQQWIISPGFGLDPNNNLNGWPVLTGDPIRLQSTSKDLYLSRKTRYLSSTDGKVMINNKNNNWQIRYDDITTGVFVSSFPDFLLYDQASEKYLDIDQPLSDGSFSTKLTPESLYRFNPYTLTRWRFTKISPVNP